MARFKLIVVFVVLLLLAIVAYQNREPIELKLTFFPVTIPVTALIFFTAVLGFSAGVIFGVRIPRNLKVTMPSEKNAAKKADPVPETKEEEEAAESKS